MVLLMAARLQVALLHPGGDKAACIGLALRFGKVRTALCSYAVAVVGKLDRQGWWQADAGGAALR